jgi:protein-L-isoaspartate(D-aspartate) O-methyltransferase
MRAVPRHVFVPRAPIEKAYAHDGVVTHPGTDGRPRSMASAPFVVAQMLEQLDVQPGDRVLEIGAGTGYNAALLAYLAGPDGKVTAVDLDEDVVDAAQQALAAGGYGEVHVVCGDGEYGYPDHAPYDRLIVTAGAWDVPPAWTDQLAAGGRIVVPLRMRGLTRSVALERHDGFLRSRSMRYCGFIPMRGAGHCPEPTLKLSEDIPVLLRLDDRRAVVAEALGRALSHPARHRWLGVMAPEDELGHFEFWLACMEGFCRLLAKGDAVEQGLVKPMYGWGSMAVIDLSTGTPSPTSPCGKRPVPTTGSEPTNWASAPTVPTPNSSPTVSPTSSAAGIATADHRPTPGSKFTRLHRPSMVTSTWSRTSTTHAWLSGSATQMRPFHLELGARQDLLRP